MGNVRLAKGMKFLNSQVFRKDLREYVIQHLIDVKRSQMRRRRFLYIVRTIMDGGFMPQW